MNKLSLDASTGSGTKAFKPDAIIFTDGGCHNTGPRKGDGAWAFTEYHGDAEVALVYAGCMMDTTNNRAEMMAVINGIKHYREHSNILIVSDSGYVVKGYNHQSYLDTWSKNGWKTSSGGDVLNVDLWQELLSLSYRYGLKFRLIRGHYKDPDKTCALWNSIVDRSCTTVIKNNMISELTMFDYSFKTNKLTEHVSVNID